MKLKGVRCPKCNSTAVRRREMVYKSGTSVYAGNSSNVGFSFGFSKPSKPRAWIGQGRHSGRRQSLLAVEAERLPYWPAFLILFFIAIFQQSQETINAWTWGGLIFVGLWIASAVSDHRDFKRNWLCGKCGKSFLPSIKNEGRTENKTIAKIKEVEEMTQRQSKESESGKKTCVVCDRTFPIEEFLTNSDRVKSYCKACHRLESHIAARNGGGSEGAAAAREWREITQKMVSRDK